MLHCNKIKSVCMPFSLKRTRDYSNGHASGKVIVVFSATFEVLISFHTCIEMHRSKDESVLVTWSDVVDWTAKIVIYRFVIACLITET